MDEREDIKEIIRSLEMNLNDAYSYELYSEKLLKTVRKNATNVVNAITEDNFTATEILYIAEITPQYTSLSGTTEIIDALSAWLERNSDYDTSGDIRGYIEEARRTYASFG